MKKVFVISSLMLVQLLAQAEVVKLELPPETGVYKIAPGSDLAQAQCMTCHSVDYVTSQPPMARAFWKGSVDKMIGKYGAQIPADQVDALVDYLARNYGTEGTNSVPATPVTAESKPAITDAKELATKYGCLACHNPTQKIIGPAYKDVAAKYKNNPEAIAKISHQITNGGGGQWGQIPMPPFTQLSASEVKTLAEWVLAQP